MIDNLKSPLLKVLYILDESKNEGRPQLTVAEISQIALLKHEIELTEKSIIGAINGCESGLIKQHTGDGDTKYEILKPGRRRLDTSPKGKPEAGLFEQMHTHPRIQKVSKKLFEDGHYPQAIFEAFKEVNNMVKRKSGQSTKDGSSLMSHVFTPSNPVLSFSGLKTPSEKDEQEGFMMIFMGAMTGIRNPKAHEHIIQRDPVKAFEYITFASLLARRIDDARK